MEGAIWFVVIMLVLGIWSTTFEDRPGGEREKLLDEAESAKRQAMPAPAVNVAAAAPAVRVPPAPPVASTTPAVQADSATGSAELAWRVMQSHGRLVEVDAPDGKKLWVPEKHQAEALDAMAKAMEAKAQAKAQAKAKRKARRDAKRQAELAAEPPIVATPAMEQWEIEQAELAETKSP